MADATDAVSSLPEGGQGGPDKAWEGLPPDQSESAGQPEELSPGPATGARPEPDAPGPDQSLRQGGNVYASELTFEEAELIYACQTISVAAAPACQRGDRAWESTLYTELSQTPAPRTDTPRPGVALQYPQMEESDMDQLLRDLNDDAARADWPPGPGQLGEAPLDCEMAAEEEGPSYELYDVTEAGATEQLQLLRGLEVTLATVDDTTVETRTKVDGIALDTSIVAAQTGRLESSVGVVAAEVTQLRKDMYGLQALSVEVAQLRKEVADTLGILSRIAERLDGLTARVG